MAGVEVSGGGRAGRKPVSSELSMVPMIDLLLCCIMFLLVTAVWSQLASVGATQRADGGIGEVEPPPAVALMLSVRRSGFLLADSAGTRTEIPQRAGAYDLEALGNALRARRSIEPARRDLVVAPEDGIRYAEVLAAMDVSRGQGYADLSLSADSAF